MHTYLNPWHKPQDASYGPKFYTCEGDPTEYRGFQIFHRIAWELVKDGVCIAQRGSKRNCQGFADLILSGSDDFFVLRAKELLAKADVRS